MSNLVNEILLRLAKAASRRSSAWSSTRCSSGLLGVTGSAELALLCWLGGAAFILLVETHSRSALRAARFDSPHPSGPRRLAGGRAGGAGSPVH